MYIIGIINIRHSNASRADGFRGGTSAGGVTGDVKGSELAEISQQIHVSVMGHNINTALMNKYEPLGEFSTDLEVEMGMRGCIVFNGCFLNLDIV